jgi:peptidoglycan/xylan/chitin deacetylase (PgdA/CDA1 family)
MSTPRLNGCNGAISLSFDDGSQTQLDIAIPILDEFDLRGTFYINPRDTSNLNPWRQVGLNGHEIGNHTIQHICTQNFDWAAQKTLETSTLDEIEADVVEAERRLQELLPEQPNRTFCYPCYQNYVGQGLNRKSYVPMIARHFPAARGTGETANHPLFTDLHYLTSWIVAGWMTGEDLCKAAETTDSHQRWIIFVFHGFQDGLASVWNPAGTYHAGAFSGGEFRKLCEFLVDNRHRLWTDTVVNVSQSIIDWRKSL